MKKYKQTIRHNAAEGISGNCYPTSIACLIERDPSEVPDIYEGFDIHNDMEKDDAYVQEMRKREARMDDYLRDLGFVLIRVAYSGVSSFDTILETVGDANPGIYYLVSGECHDDLRLSPSEPRGDLSRR